MEKNATNFSQDDTKIRSYHGGRSSFGIPSSLVEKFYEWYELHYRRGFKDYEVNESSESLKHSLEPTSSESKPKKSIKTAPSTSEESDAEFENFIHNFPVEPSPFAIEPLIEDYFSTNVLSDIPMVFPCTENEKTSLTIYTE